MKAPLGHRVLLLLTVLLAGYQIVIGIDGLATVPIVAYTTAFGVLVVAGLLLLILGLDVLESPAVVVVSTVIPLSLSLGLVWQHLSQWRTPYLIFALMGFLAVLVTRLSPLKGQLPILALAVVHGIAGVVITLLPIALSASGLAPAGFALVGMGGGLIGAGGLLLSFLKSGRPLISRGTILAILPGLLLLTTAAFLAGFKSG